MKHLIHYHGHEDLGARFAEPMAIDPKTIHYYRNMSKFLKIYFAHSISQSNIVTITTEIMDSCRKQLKTCMICRLTNKAMLALRSMTKVEWVMETIEEEEEAK